MKREIRDWGLGIGSVRQRRRPDRAGYALVLFLMMVFGLMALAALVIDFGFARLAQRQMQTAVDSAALEGLRWQWRERAQWEDLPQGWLADADFQAQVGVSGTVAGSMSTQQCEKVRRWAASRMTANTFDDDLDPTNGDTGQYGAGPVVNFTGGITGGTNDDGVEELAASQLMQPGTPPVYKPKRAGGTLGLELNYTDDTNRDAIQGDMVAGTCSQNLTYDQQSPRPSADEDDNYNRRDFTPYVASSASAPAFLVRMRRTPLWNVSGSLDDAPGVSSAGPPLPFLFARGTSIYQQPGAAYSPRRDGITVRATAIAAAGTVTVGHVSYEVGRAMTVGRPYNGIDVNKNPVNIPGSLSAVLSDAAGDHLYYVVLNLSQWNQWKSLPNSSPVTVVISADGAVRVRAADGTITPTPSGYVADGSKSDPTDTSPLYPAGRPLLGNAAMVGDQAMQIPAQSVNPSLLANKLASESRTGVAYIPIVENNPGPNASMTLFHRVVGFGYVYGIHVSPNATNTSITFTVGSSGTIASQNASATLGVVLPKWFTDPSLGSARTNELFTDYSPNDNNLMLTPVLVNHYIGPTP